MLRSWMRLLAGVALLSACTGEIVPAASSDHVNADAPDDIDLAGDAGARDGGAEDDGRTVRRDPTGRAADADDAGAGRAGAPSTTSTPCAGRTALPSATGLRIREIALYQTVKSTLYAGGAWVAERAVPVVQGKGALVRVFVDTLPGYLPHAVRATLTLRGGAGDETLVDERTIVGGSSDAELGSTFSFRLDPAQVSGDTQLGVALYEARCSARSGAVADTRAPVDRLEPLRAAAVGALRVVVVPISVNGRTPKTGPTELASMRAYLQAYYPVPDVEVTVRTRPMVWTSSLSGTDSRGWSDLLTALMRERRTDAPPADVYYYGLVQPAETLRSYCPRGCVLGIAPQTTRVMPSGQVALGATFGDAQSYETMVHELGHAHGRGHAPCAGGGGIQGVDGAFPQRDGATGSWGWDSRTSKLLPPTYKDVMGYCHPNWISAYTYAGLAARSERVNQRAFVHAPVGAARWQQLVVYADGTARWTDAVETSHPGGEPEPASVRDAAGRTLAEIEVVRIALSDVADQLLYVPELPPDWHALVLHDRVVQRARTSPLP